MGQKVNRLIPCPLGQYALSVSTNPEKLISLIVRMRTNRGSTVYRKSEVWYLKKLNIKLTSSISFFFFSFKVNFDVQVWI